MRVLNTIRKFEYQLDRIAENFIWHHPLLGFLLVFLGMPLFVLLSVCISTVVITVPMAWLLGWL